MFGLFACDSATDEEQYSSFFSNEELSYPVNIEQGKKLMENRCYVCHNPSIPKEQLIAPPLIQVKEAYHAEDFGHFLADMKRWLNHPDTAYTKMPKSIEQFGLMPKQKYSEETIDLIANYMFRAQIEAPEWWSGNNQGNQAKEHFETAEDQGLHYAMSTKRVLGMNLMGTIQKSGTLAALEFCNVAAIPLTDSMSQKHQVYIQRVSDKPRNPNNRATGKALEWIEKFKNDFKIEKEVTPITERIDDKIHFYYPIETNDMCLQCHGKSNAISNDVAQQLANLYPNDEATGYEVNQVRGVWHIIFDAD